MTTVTYSAIHCVPEVIAGMDLAQILQQALRLSAMQVAAGDILVIAQKIVSKAEGRTIDLRLVNPGAAALELAGITGKDPRLVEVILGESSEVVRAAANVLIVRHRLGFVMANAGIDRSNVPQEHGHEQVLLLPEDPDASALAIADSLLAAFGVNVGVIITDSFGRPWRNGVVNVAIGCSGVPALVDRRGASDRCGRSLEMTEVALADAIAAGAAVVMGEAAEGIPAVLVRGVCWNAAGSGAAVLLRPRAMDLFR